MADRVSRSVLEFSTTGVDQVTGAYDKVERKAKQTGDSVTGLSQRVGSLTTAFKAFIGLEITSRLVSGLGAIAKAVDEFDTLAGRINASVEDAQRLKAMATTFDTELGSVVNAIQTLRERLGEGKLDAPLRAINLEVDTFRHLDGKEQYLQVAEALGRIEDPALRAATAKKLLGANAKELANTFRTDVRDGMSGVLVITNETADAVDLLKTAWDKGTQSAIAFSAQLLATMSGMQAYVRLKEAFGAPEVPVVAQPEAFTAAAQAVDALTLSEAEMTRVERELTESAQERIKANQAAIKAAEDRSAAERAYYNWVGEREIAAVQAVQERLDREQAAWREYYNWLGERRMENEAALLASQQRIAQGAAQMFQTMMSGGAAFNGTGAWMNRPTVPMDSPTAGGGGGGWMSRLGGMFSGRGGQMLGSGLGMLSGMIPGQSNLGTQIGSIAGMALGPIGSMLGGLAGGLIGRLFGGGESGKTKKARDEWLESIGGADQLRERAEKAGVSLEKMFATKKVKDFEAEAKRVMAAIEGHEQKVLALQEEMAGLEAERARLEQETAVSFDQMQSISERFGINQDALGNQFQGKRLGADAKELIDAIEVMRKGDAEMNVVYLGMKEEISALIRDSVKYGTEIPENLKPVIESLFAQGELLDENGEKLTELPKIKFGEAIKSEMEKASDKLAEVVERLAEVLSQLTDLDGKKVSFDVEGRYREDDTPSRRDDESGGYKVGTLGRHGSFWQDFGRATRTVLHGVEAVVRPDQALSFARSVLGASEGGAGTPLVIQMDGAVAARAMIRRTGRQLSLVGA